MPKARKGLRFNCQVYEDFRNLASKNSYTVTGALEKFMANAVKFGLVFPSSQRAAAEDEARVMRHGLKRASTGLTSEAKKRSKRGRLLQLLPKVENAWLRVEIEENLKKKA